MQSYQFTGKTVPIQTSVLLEYVLNKFKKYDEYVESTGEEPEYNPYSSPILYRLDNGKVIEVPKEIIKEAVNIKTNLNVELKDTEFRKLNETPEKELVKIPPKVSSNEQMTEKPTSSNNTMIYIIVIVVLIAIAFYFYKKSKKN